MKEFFRKYKKEAALVTGLLLCLFFFFVNPLGLDLKAKLVLSIAVLMISWWVLDAMPLAVVALLPLVLYPLLSINSIKETSRSYSDSIIYLFMGGFFLGMAIEKWNLHKRIALSIIKFTGTNGNNIILGFILATGFLSMWLSNTATTMMMYPIGASVIHVISKHADPNANIKNFSLTLMLSLAYASNFGGIATIIGTPPNVAYIRHLNEHYKHGIDFANWMMLCMPLAVILLLVLYLVMVKWLYPNHLAHSLEGRNFIHAELKEMGKFSRQEKRVLIVFCSTAFLWISKDLINASQKLFQLDDSIIAMTGAISLFMVPSGRTKEDPDERLLEWSDTRNMAWGILLLFGGGIALAKSLEDAKLMQSLGQYIAGFATDNILVLIFVVTLISVFLSEVMSNIAQVIVMAPVISAVADALQINPLLLGIPMTLGASCASMMPMGTPPNAIVFASGHIKLNQMLKTGFVLNIICVILITLFSWLLLPLIVPGF
ncbi:MAG: DASS family sodium-coupled anion symporter [Chitinophagaceae bacterium]|nr:DASS family sodium-coupled anion symporter [Chitinophagaceae bacterium]